jgi:putative flippase GtrA
MKKIDIILALVTGEAVALLFIYIFRGIVFLAGLKFLNWLLPLIFPILALIGLWICYLLGKKFFWIFQLGKFFLTGSFITAVDVWVLNFLMWVSGIVMGFWFSVFKGISFLIATAVKYLGSKFWIFEKFEVGITLKEISQFLLVTLIGLGINVGVAVFLVNILGPLFEMTKISWASISGIIAAFCTAIWNFLGYKFIVFKK